MNADDQRQPPGAKSPRDRAANDEAPPAADADDEPPRAADADGLDEVRPDAVSPEVRSDSGPPVRGGMTADDGLGAAGGRDRGGPGGRANDTPVAGEGPGRGVNSSD